MKALAIGKDIRYILESLKGCTEEEGSSRPFLEVIHHDEEKGRLVATNGRAILVFEIPDTKPFGPLREFIRGEQSLTYDKGMLYTVDSPKGDFPKYEKVIPDTSKGYQEWEMPNGTMCFTASKAPQMKLYAALTHAGAELGLFFNFSWIEPVKVAFSRIFVKKDAACKAVTDDGMFTFVMMPMHDVSMERRA